MPLLLRSNIEFSKRVFLDRLTCYSQPLLQADPGNIDEGPGDQYDYAGVGDATDFGIGFDCSGISGVMGGIAINGPKYFGLQYKRLFSTETFPGPLQGFRQVSQQDLLSNPYPIKVCIMHGGGGPDSHMNICIDGIVMESNGDHGVCTLGHGAIGQDSSFWNDFWVMDGPIVEDTTWRCPMSYPRGLDYAGGRISGADLKAAGIAFVFRYLTDGGPGLPGKQLLPDEFQDLINNGIQVAFNWETTSDFMLGGHDAGVSDAVNALNYIRTLPGLGTYQPVIYFSCDFDEAPGQDQAIFDYCRGAASALGGVGKVGLYGPYWICKRARDAGVVGYTWQTEAWSASQDGTHIDFRTNVVQRNNAGYQSISGVQCDINEAHTDDFGQYSPTQPAPNPAPSTPPGEQVTTPDYSKLAYEQLMGPIGDDGYGHGWPQLQNYSVVDFLSKVLSPQLQQIQTTLTSMQSKPTTSPLQVPVPKGKQ